MARKRIKTLASEWGVSVDDILQSCARLRLGHTNSESSLLAQDEVDRIRGDLDEQAHRAAVMRRETVVETSGGKLSQHPEAASRNSLSISRSKLPPTNPSWRRLWRRLRLPKRKRRRCSSP